MTFEDVLKQGPPPHDKPLNRLGLGESAFTAKHRDEILTRIDFIKEEIHDQDYDSAYRMLNTLADMVKKL